MTNEIICCDVLNGIKLIPKKTIDFVLTDPPYNISDFTDADKKNNMHKGGFSYKYKYCNLIQADWDFEPMNKEVCKELYRVLKNGSAIACFYDIWKMGELREWLKESKFHQFRICEWEKKNPTPINSKRNYLSNAKEFFLYCVKGWKATFNSQYDNGTYRCSLCHPPERQHPTQKPLQLIKEIILKHTKPGDTVLDCYAGAGTTAVACKLTGRNFICFDNNKEYCDIAKNRLSVSGTVTENPIRPHENQEI